MEDRTIPKRASHLSAPVNEDALLPSVQDALCWAEAAGCAGTGTHSRVSVVLSTQLGHRSPVQGSALAGSFGPHHDYPTPTEQIGRE